MQRGNQAEDFLRKGLALLQPPDHSSPETGKDYQRILAFNRVLQGMLFLGKGRYDLAETSLKEGIRGFEQLLQIFPKNFVVRNQLMRSYPGLAELYERTKRPAEAEKIWQQTVDLTEQALRDYPTFVWLAPLLEQFRLSKIAVQFRQGEVAKSMPELKTWTEKKGLSGTTCYNLACLYSLASAAVRGDPRQSGTYAEKAMELLNTAERAGYFRNPATVAHARKDEDLEALRTRKEFQDLMTRLEKKGSAARPVPQAP
jgi:tetratricopeptide (TPR) repeat protein